MFAEDTGASDISPRDATILKARLKYPEAAVSTLRDILEEEFDISLSHNRVNEILNELHDSGLYTMRAIPNRDLFEYYLFQVAFHYSNFEEHWERCFGELCDDPHVILFCSADDYHEWQFVAQFTSSEKSEEWRHEFVKKYGSFIAQIDKTGFPTVHKFETDHAILDELISEMDGGEEYVVRLDSNADTSENTRNGIADGNK